MLAVELQVPFTFILCHKITVLSQNTILSKNVNYNHRGGFALNSCF